MTPTTGADTAPAPRPGETGRKPAAILFDLDGTLLDTAPDLIGCAEELLREQGITPPPAASLLPVVSQGSVGIVRHAFHLAVGEPRIEALQKRFLGLYENRLSRCTRPFEGIPEVLDAIERRGLAWAVVTNKPAWLTVPLLRELGLAGRPGCIVCGDTLGHSKPHPAPLLHACRLLGIEPGRTLMVGDDRRDVIAGHAAGTGTLAALFGYIGAGDHPADWGADGLLADPLDLLAWLDRDMYTVARKY